MNMSKLPIISGKKCVKTLQKIGFTVYRQRESHITLVQEKTGIQVTVPNHRTISKGTLRSIIRQIGLNVNEFVDLL